MLEKIGSSRCAGHTFYEFARVVQEVNPAICIGENVRGLLNHDNGRTLEGMISILDEIGYKVMPAQVLKAINYNVPQKRERLILVGVRKDIDLEFEYPKPYPKIYNLEDALKKGELFETNVPKSKGASYPDHKKKRSGSCSSKRILRDLPLDIQKEYMQKAFIWAVGKREWREE